MLNNDAELISPIFNLSEIESIIEGRISYLFSHFKYLNAIQKNEIEQEDKQSYFRQIFGLKLSNEDIINNSLQIQEIVRNNLKFYQELLKACRLPNKEQTVSLLFMLIEYQLNYSKQSKKILNSKGINKKDKFQAAFHDYDILKLMRKQLEFFLPESYASLSEIIEIKEYQEQKKENNGYYIGYQILLRFNWNEYKKALKVDISNVQYKPNSKEPKRDIKKKFEVENKMDFEKFFENARDDLGEEGVGYFRDYYQTASLVNAHIQKNKALANQEGYDKLMLLKENIQFFYKIYPAFSNLKNFLSKISQQVDADNQHKIAVKYYKAIASDIKTNIQELIANATMLLSKFKELINIYPEVTEQIRDISEKILDMNASLQAMYEEWSNECPAEIKSKQEVVALEEGCNKAYKKFATKIKKIDQIYHQISKELKVSALNSLQEQIEKNLQETKKNKEERLNNLKVTDEENKRYKESVANRRKELNALKRYQGIFLPKPNFHTTVFKNEDMEKIVESLSDYHLNLIRSILNLEKNIKSHEVYALITNQLGGSISEIGHGSSHKRIALQKIYIEIITYDDGSTQNASETAVGGFFKQHGGTHNSQELCRFNLKLIADIFDKAKISLTLLNGIDAKRQSEKAQALTT